MISIMFTLGSIWTVFLREDDRNDAQEHSNDPICKSKRSLNEEICDATGKSILCYGSGGFGRIAAFRWTSFHVTIQPKNSTEISSFLSKSYS